MVVAEAVDITIDAPALPLEAGETYRVPVINVYYKRVWGTPGAPDEWLRRPNLHADQLIFNSGTQPGVASLSRDYGIVARAHREPLAFKVWAGIPKVFGWIKVEALLDENQPPIVLFVGPMVRIQQNRAAKHESITCRDLKHVLQSVVVLEAFAENHDHIRGGTPEEENIVEVGWSPAFNAGDGSVPASLGANRSVDAYEFEINTTEVETHVFTNSGSRRWTSRDILIYMAALAHKNTELRWKIVDDFGEDDDDPLAEVEPVIEVEGRSILEVIHEAVTTGGMGYSVVPWLEGDIVVGGIVRLYTLHSEDIDVGEGESKITVKGNPRVVALPVAAPWLVDKWEISDTGFDETFVRGQRIRATRSITNNGAEFPQADVDVNLQEDWSPGTEADYGDSANRKSEAWDAVFCRFKADDAYNPNKATEVGGIDPRSGDVQTQKQNRIKGPSRTLNTSLRYGALHDGGAAELTHAGRAQVAYVITRDPNPPKHYDPQENVRIRDDAIGFEVLGGPLANPNMEPRHDRVAFTFGIALDYRVEAADGERSERGFNRIQVVRSATGRMSIAHQAIVHTGKDGAEAVDQASGVLSDFARLRQIALLKHSRYSKAIEFVSLASRRLLLELAIGVIARVGNQKSATPVSSLTWDLKRGSTAAQTAKTYAGR